MKSRISAKEAAYVARESLKRRAIRLLAPEGGEQPPGARPLDTHDKPLRVS